MAASIQDDGYRHFRVYDADGSSGRIERTVHETGGAGDMVAVRLESGGELLVPAAELRQRPDGAFDLPVRFGDRTGGGDVTIPVVEERAAIGKERVETGRVRVTRHVREREEVLEESVSREEVDVERVPVNEFVEGPVAVRTEGDTTVVPVLEEVLVVQRRLLLKEEIRLTRRRVDAVASERVTLLSEDVEVERVPADGRPPDGEAG